MRSHRSLGELLRAKALRRMQNWRNIRARNIGTRIRLPESTTDDDMLDSHARRFVSNGGGPDLRLTLADRKLGRGASGSSRYGKAF